MSHDKPASATQKPTLSEPKKFSNIKPILGSDLQQIQNSMRRRRRNTETETETSKGGNNDKDNWDKDNVRCGITGIDEYVLRGGFERGCVVGLSGDLGGGDDGGCAVGRLITMYLIASVVLRDMQLPGNSSSVSTTSKEPQGNPSNNHRSLLKQRAKARAAIIDTTGSFPLPLLASIIRTRILKIYANSRIQIMATELNEAVRDCLERVSYLRALDFVGVVEAVAEVRKGCEDVERMREERWRGVVREKALRMAKGEEEKDKKKRERGKGDLVEIGDSDEDDDSEDEDVVGGLTVDDLTGDGTGDEGEDEGTTEILVLDNFTNMAGRLFGETERDSAHNLISTLTQTLHILTKTHNLLTILPNSTTPLTNASSGAKSHQNQNQHQPAQQNNPYIPPKRTPTPTRSIFTSTATTLRPAFEKTFDQIPDLHLFLSRLPRTKRDAEVLYGGDEISDFDERGGGGGRRGGEVEYCHIIEVLRDDYASPGARSESREGGRRVSREQRWTPFVISADGVGIEDILGDEGGSGMVRSRDAEVNVAKTYGFGGRGRGL